MKLKIKRLKFLTGKPVCMIHEKTAEEMSLHIGERILISNKNNKKIISIVNIVNEIIKPHEIAVSDIIFKKLNLKNKKYVNVKITEKPLSISLIKKKLKGKSLTKKEIQEIVQNIANNSLSEVEVAFFISAIYTKGMSIKETKYLTQSMVETGNKMNLKGKVVDKHSLGGVAGNRTTPIVVSICASEGLIMPKTSSRAITSAAGTADTIETIAKVDFSIPKIKKIIKKTNACFVWGGALGLAPVDDKIISIERIVNIDPPAQMLASILSKKISVGSKYILIDIPYGKSAKVSKTKAKTLKRKFLSLGKKFGLKIEVVLTNGSEPIGNGIGPALEIEDILSVLTRINSPKDLEKKSVMLAGKLLELAKKVKKGKGEKRALEILNSGKALDKFREIIKAQQESGKKRDLKIKKSKFIYEIKSPRKIKIKHIDNKLINQLARQLGCPEDKLAGIYIHKKKGTIAEKGDILLTLYAFSKEKLEYGKNFYRK